MAVLDRVPLIGRILATDRWVKALKLVGLAGWGKIVAPFGAAIITGVLNTDNQKGGRPSTGQSGSGNPMQNGGVSNSPVRPGDAGFRPGDFAGPPENPAGGGGGVPQPTVEEGDGFSVIQVNGPSTVVLTAQDGSSETVTTDADGTTTVTSRDSGGNVTKVETTIPPADDGDTNPPSVDEEDGYPVPDGGDPGGPAGLSIDEMPNPDPSTGTGGPANPLSRALSMSTLMIRGMGRLDAMPKMF